MSSIFSGLSDIIQSELEIQTAAITRRYDAEISFAEWNTYKVKKLEREKEQEIAKMKNEANRKMFAMQVIQAVAQTAMAAINAYSSAAQVPMIGYILAPIAAAMAVAAGAIQIAAIKKQQQASEAQGYAEGGYTPKGPKDMEVGVVHAGEWVASQALVAALASNSAAMANYSSVMRQLEKRLEEPFVTVNTVEGDRGIKRAQDEYDNLMRNKTPRTQR